jgi:hypothetical protein
MVREGLALLVIALGAGAAHGHDLRWRVSVKVFLDENGDPAATGSLNTDDEILGAFDLANALLNGMRSPFTFEVTEIVDIAGHSEWFHSGINQGAYDMLLAEVQSDPSEFLLRDDAINFYVFGSASGGWCMRSSDGEPRISIVGQDAEPTTPFHEAGHVLGLCHSHGCTSQGVDCTSDAPCAGIATEPTDDRVEDTLPEKDCWNSRDLIACYNFGDVFSNISSAQQQQVDDVWFNMMSYHGTRDRLTLDQLDVLFVTTNQVYAHAATGLVHFVGGEDITTPNDLSETPFAAIPGALVAAELTPGDDVLLIRSGAYSQPLVISQPVCLRATRGVVLIGQ